MTTFLQFPLKYHLVAPQKAAQKIRYLFRQIHWQQDVLPVFQPSVINYLEPGILDHSRFFTKIGIDANNVASDGIISRICLVTTPFPVSNSTIYFELLKPERLTTFGTEHLRTWCNCAYGFRFLIPSLGNWIVSFMQNLIN